MFRVLALIMFGGFALIFFTDYYVVYQSQIKLERAVEQALDGAIIAATQESEHQRGIVRLDPAQVIQATRLLLMENLKLDGNMENDFYTGSSLQVHVEYLGGKPRIVCRFDTHVRLKAGRVFGQDEWLIRVRKHTPYFAEFI